MRGAIKSKITHMVRLNKSRANYQEKFQRLIDDYNAGSKNVELLFKELVELAQDLNKEEQRHVAEQLSEEELTMFDLLAFSQSELSEKEKDEVKKVVRSLLATLKREKLVLDWRKKQQARANVFITVRDMLNERLPGVYTPEMSKRKCDEIYQHLFDAYYGQGQSLYDKAS